MLEEKVRNNLYKIINQYYKILKSQYKRTEPTYKIEQEPSELKQNLLNYETSIFKNIENKHFSFTELFKLDKEIIYSLNPYETEILRIYVGIYDDGKKQSVQEVARRLEIPSSRVSNTLKKIMDNFESKKGQELLIRERNKDIKEKIQNYEYRKQILNSDITFLNITDNFIDILREEKINTVEDLLKITEEQVERINIQYGYYPNLKIIPKRLIDEIHNIGLKFEDEIMISQMFHEYIGVTINPKIKIDKSFGSIKDIISARQFEPELLSALILKKYLMIDKKINEGYMEEMIMDMSENILAYKEEIEMNQANGMTKRFIIEYPSDNN